MPLIPLSLFNTGTVSLEDIPVGTFSDFRDAVMCDMRKDGRVVSFFGMPSASSRVRLFCTIAHDKDSTLNIFSTTVDERYPSLTIECPQFHMFEREIAEQWGIIPEGHPWLKPVRFHHSYLPGHDAWARPQGTAIDPGVTNFYQIHGEEIHEVAVGPVHAGIIEPGHFRFQCHGEHVFYLEIALGYQHRGIQRALIGGPNKRTLHYMETLAGDTTIGHALAYCQGIEAASQCMVPGRAQILRGMLLELERLANHTGDLGALAHDVAYLPTASYCGRLRGDFLNMTALVCGSRFGRGMLRPGGVGFDIDERIIKELQDRLNAVYADVTRAIDLLWATVSVVDRFEGTGTVTRESADMLGLVGVAARACGLNRDVRSDFPSGIYRFTQIPIATYASGDVFGRAYVRWLEIQKSAAFIRDQLKTIPEGEIAAPIGTLRPHALTISLVEGWRGEICHVLITDANGMCAHYHVVDPSFHNWTGLAMALRDEQISDFPVCNKSFNLSYCGHDL